MYHSHLSQAKITKNDEFYTRYEDIVSEVQRYDLRGMSVYCNCDDAESAFIRYFIENFHQHGLKKLYASGIRGEYVEYDGKHIQRKRINGDFRSEDCKAILEKADVCITNPPFSLFREYIELVPNFLIIGNKNAISYKELFPMLKDGRCKLGYTHPDEFYTPDGSLVNLNGLCRWFTSMMVNKAPPPIIRGYSPCYLKCYDNYPAINIDRVEDIPDNYDGLMGVPITFMDYMDYEKFEIVDLIARYAVIDKSYKVKGHQLTEIDGEPKYSRIIIKMSNNDNMTNAGVASAKEQPMENGVVETPTAKVEIKKADCTIEKQSSEFPIISKEEQTQIIDYYIDLLKEAEIAAKTVYRSTVRATEKVGIKGATFEANRFISRPHTKALYKYLQDRNATKFTNAAIVMPAKPILLWNESIDKTNRLRIYDQDNTEITLDTPNVENYYVILDGQHRWFVTLEHEDIDLDLEFIEIDGNPIEFVNDYNALHLGWDKSDWIHSHSITNKIDTRIFDISAEIENKLGVSSKYAMYLITRNKEAIRKSDLEKGNNTVELNELLVKRGQGFADAIRYASNKKETEAEKDFYKAVRKIQMVEAIEHTDHQCLDPEFPSLFKCYLIKLDDATKGKIAEYMKSTDYGTLKSYICNDFRHFKNKHQKDMAELLDQCNKLMEEFKKEEEKIKKKEIESNKNKKPASLKVGSISMLLANNEAIKSWADAKAKK